MTPIPVSVVPHTHWDREWYSPFQTFRLRLVELLDKLLPAMEADPSYAHFLLDGQMAVVDDYLAIRPEAEATLRKLNASGRLAMGPWYILMDEFLVSGETMVRDLQLGLERAAAFGGAMEVGYLPDMFGHVAQMPQLLQQAGFDHAVVWRGVPSTVDRDAFWWRAPDGSTVRAQYLWPEGYGNGADLSEDAKRLVRQLERHREWMGDFFTGSILWMNGTDHQMPKPHLGRVVAEVNAMQDTFELRVRSLEEHVRSGAVDGLPTHEGELRSGARANLLMGVASNRVDVKIAAARAERSIERRAEPLCALFLPAEDWPGALLAEAWRSMILNSAHDSSCACSHDEVVDAVIHRYQEARQIADGLGNRALRMVAAVVDHTGPVLVNASARARAGVVELTVPGDEPLPDDAVQVLSSRPAVLRDEIVDADGLAAIFSGIRSQLLDPRTILNRIEVVDDGVSDVIDVTLHADERMMANLVISEEWARLAEVIERRPGARFCVRIEQPPSRRVVVRTDVVPGYGWAAWTPPSTLGDGIEPVSAVGSSGLTNGLVTIEVSSADGSFSLDGVPGFDRLVDDGDHGDTYNYSPPDNDLVVDRPVSVSIDVLESGPVRGRIRVVRRYEWPARIDDASRARVGSVLAEVVTVLEVQAGSPLVRIKATVDNQARDHRLRAWFPLPSGPATSSFAECAFGVVARPTTAEGGPHEHPLPTQPCRRFVCAGGLTVVQEGLLEYELVDVDASAAGAPASSLALTLLRASGMLSRIEMTYRPMPAGPPVVLRGSQVLGEHTLRYGVCAGDDPLAAYALVDDAFLPLDVARAPGIGAAPVSGSALSVSGAEVSALRREAGRLELRVFNPSPSPTTCVVEGRTGWLVDLRGRPIEPFEESVPLGPWRIATLRLDD